MLAIAFWWQETQMYNDYRVLKYATESSLLIYLFCWQFIFIILASKTRFYFADVVKYNYKGDAKNEVFISIRGSKENFCIGKKH